ncbi:acyl-CoA dehydrogenase family protein [Ferrovibrio xuzhouensis]|uniref:Acyl-CoA dehydrogenase family protein n=1 Tax=Ferrovibrio xuzhouensis TaxID=1576914 RepID=A0ABV7VJF5_9PROT
MDRSYLNWPFFEEHHRRLAACLQDWAAKHAAHHDEDADIDDVCRGFVRQLGKDGFLGLTVPRDGGGLNEVLDVRALALAREILAYHHGLADFAFVMQGLGSGPISLFGTPEQKRRWLPGVANGSKIAALAMSEPDAGSDVANVSTVAVPDGQGFRLNGVKTWISNGGIADQYTVIARLGDAPGTKGLACFVVEAGTPGFSVPERIDVMAPHPLGRLEFRDCVIPAGNLIGRPGEGFKIAMSNLDVFRSTVGAAALGFARRALDEALRRVHVRKVFDQKLADYQLTQARIADMATEIDASALLVYRAAWTKDRGADRVTREASMAKMYATEAAQRVIDAAVQLWGGLGVTRGVMVESLYREIRALRIYEGTTEVNKLVIAGQTYAAYMAENGAASEGGAP